MSIEEANTHLEQGDFVKAVPVFKRLATNSALFPTL